MLLLYVDDVLMVGSNTELLQRLKRALLERFAIKDMRKRCFLHTGNADHTKPS